MVLLGLLLVIIAVAAGVALFLGTEPLTSEVRFEVGVLNFVFTPLQLLIAGAAVMLLLAIGLGLIRGALRRRRRARQEVKDAQRQAELEESIRADERTRADEAHRSELDERQRAHEAELAERDRTREEDFASRRAELEHRIRLDERAKVERGLGRSDASSDTGPGAATAVGAGAAGAAGAAGTAAAASRAHDTAHDGDLQHDADGHESRHDAGLAAGSSTADGVTVAPEADRAADDDAQATRRQPVVEPAEPGERTIADRLMGRDPADRRTGSHGDGEDGDGPDRR